MASNHFKKSFFVKPCVWLHMENRIFRKCISFNRKNKGFDLEIILRFYFHFKPFSDLGTERERERERERETPQTELQSDDPYSTDPPTMSFLHSNPPFSLIHHLFHSDPSKTELVINPPKTELIHRAMPKAPTSSPFQLRRPLHFFLFKLNPKPRNLENPFLKPIPTNPPLRRTHSANPFLKPISQTPTGRRRSLSLYHLSPSLTLRCFCDFFCFDFCFFDCLYILILCNNICLDPKKM